MEAGHPRELLTTCHLHRRGEYPHDRARHSREGPLGDIALPRCHLAFRTLRDHRPLRTDGDDRADEGATLPTLRTHTREATLISADESCEYICTVIRPFCNPRAFPLSIYSFKDCISRYDFLVCLLCSIRSISYLYYLRSIAKTKKKAVVSIDAKIGKIGEKFAKYLKKNV